jgi:hypothetical protein
VQLSVAKRGFLKLDCRPFGLVLSHNRRVELEPLASKDFLREIIQPLQEGRASLAMRQVRE